MSRRAPRPRSARQSRANPRPIRSAPLAIRVEVRASTIHGRGLFAPDGVPRRMKIGELSGVLRRLPAARQHMQRRQVIHLVEVSLRWALDCSRGNALRHINHACTANCFMRFAPRTTAAGRRVEVYAKRALPPGSELTVDYGETPHVGGMSCRCGAPGCRGKL